MSINYNTTPTNRGLLFSCDFSSAKVYSRRENLFDQSENFTAPYWNNAFTTVNVLSSTELAPNGTNTAILMQARNQSYGGLMRTYSILYKTFTTYTMSIYAKAGSWNFIGLRPSGDACQNLGDTYTFFNLSNGSSTNLSNPRNGGVTLASGAIPVGNGWYRCWVTFTTGSLQPEVGVSDFAIVSSTGNSLGVSANKFNGNETVYLWGAMVERGNTLGDYIRTSGSPVIASTITDPISGLTGSLNNYQYYNYDTSTNSINFDRSSTAVDGGYAQFTGTGNLTSDNFLYNNHTMEIFAKINDYSGSLVDASQVDNTLLGYQGYHTGFMYNSTGVLRYSLWNGTSNPNLSFTSSPSVGQWFHAVATRNGTTTTIYLNGVQSATTTQSLSGGNPGTSSFLKMGAANIPPQQIACLVKANLSIARMYNVALTSTEVLQNFNAFRGRGGI